MEAIISIVGLWLLIVIVMGSWEAFWNHYEETHGGKLKISLQEHSCHCCHHVEDGIVGGSDFLF